MRIGIHYDKYNKDKQGDFVEDGDGEAFIEYQVDNVEDETTNDGILEIDGVYYYFNAQDVRNALKFLCQTSSK